MGSKVQEHHGKDAKKPLAPDQATQHRATADVTVPAVVQHAIESPQRLAPKHLLALHPMAGNRAVQRLVSDTVVQRHLDEQGLSQAEDKLSDRMINAHPDQGQAVGTRSQVSGNRVTITGEWM
jgi:hypothetical protein